MANLGIRTMASKMPMMKRNNRDIKDYLNIPTQVMRQGKMIDIAQNNARIFARGTK